MGSKQKNIILQILDTTALFFFYCEHRLGDNSISETRFKLKEAKPEKEKEKQQSKKKNCRPQSEPATKLIG